MSSHLPSQSPRTESGFNIVSPNATVRLSRIISVLYFTIPLDALLYPGLGFGAVLSKARLLTDSMILAGAQRLATLSPALKDPDDALLPDFADAPSVNFEIAIAVAEQAIAEGIANVSWGDQEVRENAKRMQWLPVYEKYVYDENGEK